MVVGPLFTAAGFKAWFLVCDPDMIVAVPQSFAFAMAAATTIARDPKTNATYTGMGLLGGLLAVFGVTRQETITAELKARPLAALKGDAKNVVWPVQSLAGITLKKPLLSHPEIILSARDGKKQTYGFTQLLLYPKAAEQLKNFYPSIVMG